MTNPLDHPFDEVAQTMKEWADKGALCFQKFSCEKCGQRLTMAEPNKMYTKGDCDQCGHVTDIRARGCNFLLVKTLREPSQ